MKFEEIDNTCYKCGGKIKRNILLQKKCKKCKTKYVSLDIDLDYNILIPLLQMAHEQKKSVDHIICEVLSKYLEENK